MKLFSRFLKTSKPVVTTHSSATAISAIPTSVRMTLPTPTKRLVDQFRASIKAKRRADIEKTAFILARDGAVGADSWVYICSQLSRGKQWNALLEYLARCDHSWKNDAALLYLAGRAERNLLHPIRSIEYLRKAIALNPTDEANIELGLSLLDAGRLEEAVDFLRIFVSDSDTLNAAAPLLKRFAEAEIHSAREVIENLLASDPTNVLIATALGDFHYMAKNPLEALVAFKMALKFAPENFDIGLRIMKAALALTSDEILIDAVEIGERFFFKEPNKNLAKALANAYLRYPSSEDAENGLDRVFYAYNSDPQLLATVSAGYLRNSNIVKAETALRRALELSPNDTSLVFRLAGVLAQQSRTGEAVALMSRHIGGPNRDATFFALVGHIKAWSGDHVSAIADLREALSLDSQHCGALADLAHCYDLLGDTGIAFLTMQKALVASVTRPQPTIPGITNMNDKRIRRRLMQLAHLTKNGAFARSLYDDMRREGRMSMPYNIQNWNGDSMDGRRVLCITESGLGDEIRYTAAYRRKFVGARSVSITCDPRMTTILSRSFPDYHFYPVQRTYVRLKKVRMDTRLREVPKNMRSIVSDDVVDAGTEADVWVRGLELYETTFFGSSNISVRGTLTPREDLRAEFKSELSEKSGGRLVVGLSWRGGHHCYNRDSHYFDVQDWEKILDEENLSFVNLQYALRDDELEYLRNRLGSRLIEFPGLDLMDDIEGIAALCSALDHVVGVCTTVLELAGSVGAPVLFMMRSPQSPQTIRLAGGEDSFGAFSDNVWANCRIMPKRQNTDAEMVTAAAAYLRDRSKPRTRIPGLDDPSVIRLPTWPGNRGSGGNSPFDTAEIQD